MAGSTARTGMSRWTMLFNGYFTDLGAELTGQVASAWRRLPCLAVDSDRETVETRHDGQDHAPIASRAGSELDRAPVGEISRQLDRAGEVN